MSTEGKLVGGGIGSYSCGVMAEDVFWLSANDEVEDMVEADGESGPGILPVPAAANIGLLKGETARELNEEDVDESVAGEELQMPPLPGEPLLRMLAMVSEMVCLAACLARSVDTKVDTKSFKLPFISGEASNSKGSTLVVATAACPGTVELGQLMTEEH